METQTQTQLGEFLLAGHWLSFPGLGNSRTFVFAFTSAAQRTAFIKAWTGRTIILPGKSKFLIKEPGMEKTTRDGAFLLTIKSSGTDNDRVRQLISDKLVGKCTGHTVWDIQRYLKDNSISIDEADTQAEIDAMVLTGILIRDTYMRHHVYRHENHRLRDGHPIDHDGAIRSATGRSL